MQARAIVLLYAALLATLCAAHGTARVRSDDAFMHLALGRDVVAQGALPAHDVLLNAGEPAPQILHSWLSEVLFYKVMDAGGLRALLSLRALLVITTVLLLGWLLLRQGAPPWLVALLGVAVLLAPGIRTTLMRPLLWSHLLLVVFLAVLYQVRAGRWRPRACWALPLLMLPWANLHAGHIIGLALGFALLAAMVLDRLRGRQDPPGLTPIRAGLLLVGILAASLANPYGPQILAYALGLAGGGADQGQVWEWVGATPGREPLLFALLGAAWLVLLLRLRRADSLHTLVVLLLTLAPLLATRFLFHGAVGAALALGEGLPALLSGKGRQKLRRRGALVAAVATGLALAGMVAWAITRQQGFAFTVDRSFFPVAAVKFMQRQQLDGKLLNLREWGGYLEWHRPGKKVFVDGRVAVSAGAVIKDYAAVAEAHRGFGHVLNRRKIQLVLASYQVLRPSANFAVQPLALDANWALVYFDDVALLYARVGQQNAALVRDHGYRALVPSSNARPFRPGAPPALLEAEARRAVTLTPSERAATYLGLLLLRRGALAQAEVQLQLAARLNPKNPRALNNLGVALMRRGHKARARQLFERVLALDPSHAKARKNLELLR